MLRIEILLLAKPNKYDSCALPAPSYEAAIVCPLPVHRRVRSRS